MAELSGPLTLAFTWVRFQRHEGARALDGRSRPAVGERFGQRRDDCGVLVDRAAHPRTRTGRSGRAVGRSLPHLAVLTRPQGGGVAMTILVRPYNSIAGNAGKTAGRRGVMPTRESGRRIRLQLCHREPPPSACRPPPAHLPPRRRRGIANHSTNSRKFKWDCAICLFAVGADGIPSCGRSRNTGQNDGSPSGSPIARQGSEPRCRRGVSAAQTPRWKEGRRAPCSDRLVIATLRVAPGPMGYQDLSRVPSIDSPPNHMFFADWSPHDPPNKIACACHDFSVLR